MEHETTEAVLDAGEAQASGMPQLDFSTFPNQIFWLLVALAAIYFVLSRVALPRIGGVLAERQGTITNDIAAAEELKLKAGEAERAYEKALADARSEAHRIAEENKAGIQAELASAMEKADAQIGDQREESERRIAEIRESALANVEEVARETAQAIVGALGGEADRSRTDSAVASRLGERA